MSIVSWASFGLLGRPKVQPEPPALAAPCAPAPPAETPVAHAAPLFASADLVVVPPPMPEPAAETRVAPGRQEGSVKWFNITKGYGFVRPTHGGPDVFVHIAAVERAGLANLLEGQRISFQAVTNRGRVSVEDIELVTECKPASAPRELAPGIQRGTVKWYNPTKGYGFITPADGGRDVFLHISAVERAGLSKLSEGQEVSFRLHNVRGKTSAEDLAVH